MENLRFTSVVDYIRQRDKERNGNAIVMEFDGNQITRNEYWNGIEHYKRYFLSQGFYFGCGKPVTICNLNAPEYEFMYMALLELGAVVSTVSLSFFKNDVLRHTVDKGADTIVISSEYISNDLKEALKALGENKGKDSIKRIIFTSAGDYRSNDKAKIYHSKFDYKTMIDSLDLPKNIEIVYPGQIKKLADSRIMLPTKEKIVDLLTAKATYSNTGGTTTGIPNCAVHTHEAIIKMLQAYEKDNYPDFPIKEGEKSLLLIPISHITSQFFALLLRRASGSNIVYNPAAFDPAVITEALIEDEINDVVAPFGLYMAIANSQLKPGCLKKLRPACGGEPTPLEPTKLVNERLKMAGSEPIGIGYGSTEFGSAYITTYGVEDRTNESGLLVPSAEAMIINPLTGKKVVNGERGILYARCGWQMKEYLNDEKATNNFYNFTDEDGKVWGTNNDIARVVREYNGKPLYSVEGRVNSFVTRNPQTKRYYSGISFTNGKVNPIDLSSGNFLFDMRDRLLNVPGVIEAEAILVPYDDFDITGTPVVNLVIAPQVNPVDIIKGVYSSYGAEDFIPEGLIFRTNFARSLATDKRETVTLKDERSTYYKMDSEGNIVSVSLPKGSDPVHEIVENVETIQIVAPPEPRRVLVKR